MKISAFRASRFLQIIPLYGLLLAAPLLAGAQSSQPSSALMPKGVPRLLKFSGMLKDAEGRPRTGMAGILFAVYPASVGGAPLWLETHNVQLDQQGRYSALLGGNQT